MIDVRSLPTFEWQTVVSALLGAIAAWFGGFKGSKKGK